MRSLVTIMVFAVALTFVMGIATTSFAGSNGIGWLASDTAYRVNITAYDRCPKNDTAQRIAVLADFIDDPEGDEVVLDKRNKIYLTDDTDFRVLDSNACDGDGALLQLPVDVSTTYSLWIRLVGPPDSSIDVKTCATCPGCNGGDDVIVCGGSFMKMRSSSRPTFTNATNQLLKLNGTNLFDASYEDYFWNWNTQGKPHAQAWFVEED